VTQFSHPLHRDDEGFLQEACCTRMLSGEQKHVVSMDNWTDAHLEFAVEAYFKIVNQYWKHVVRSAAISIYTAAPDCHLKTR
jgi:hypothetical protein